ncbi:MAG: hypothetical protein Q9198_010164, partial [Flavoplaca austrocitrina]
MKQTIIFTALSSSLLYSSVIARYGLSPDDIPMLTRTVDYTFHSICDNYHNPVPTPLFNELGLARTVFDLTNDLYSFLMGYSVGSNDNDNNLVHNDKRRVRVYEDPSLKTSLREEDQRGPGLLQDLIDDVIQSNRRSELLESQTVIAKGPIGDKLMEHEEETMHSYAAKKKFDCPKFQHDLYEVCTPSQDVCCLFDCNDAHSKPRLPVVRCIGDPYTRFIRNSETALLTRNYLQFAESFKNMTYAISEKCYRQCTPTATYNTPAYAAYAVQRLQTAYERHYSGSFYTQIREIEAETGCYFDDTFMVDTERAIDYAK